MALVTSDIIQLQNIPQLSLQPQAMTLDTGTCDPLSKDSEHSHITRSPLFHTGKWIKRMIPVSKLNLNNAKYIVLILNAWYCYV